MVTGPGRRLRGWGLAALLLVPSLGSAYAPLAEAYYRAGVAAAGRRAWREAILYYRAALKVDPTLTATNRALGSTYYEAGDVRGAIYYYQLYLRDHPDDAETRRFVAALQGVPQAPSGGGGVTVEALGAPAFRPGFDLRGQLTGVLSSAHDVGELYGAGAPTGSATDLAEGFAAGADYGLRNGFVGGIDAEELVRSHAVPLPGGSAAFHFTQQLLVLTPGWRFQVGPRLLLEPRVGLGLALTALKASGAGDAVSASGSGYVIWPELRAEYEFGRFGLGASLGYLVSSTSAAASGQALVNSAGGNWSVQTSGPTLGVFGVWHFQPLF